MSKTGGNDNKDTDKKSKRTTAEWVTLGVSLVVLLGLVGLVVFVSLTRGDKPSTIKIEPVLNEVRQSEDAYYLPINITNDGDMAVGDVEVELSLASEGSEPETIAFTVLFLAGGETSQEIVAFSNDPSKGELSQVVGFHEP
jgi:uncharacterized protein (TIGR02588 family)